MKTDPNVFENTKLKLEIVEADGRLGLPEYGPYNAIHIGAAIESIPE